METARRVVLVTGTTGGDRRVSAFALWRRGGPVALLARQRQDLPGQRQRLKPQAGRHWPSSSTQARTSLTLPLCWSSRKKAPSWLPPSITASSRPGSGALSVNAGVAAALTRKDGR